MFLKHFFKLKKNMKIIFFYFFKNIFNMYFPCVIYNYILYINNIYNNYNDVIL